MPQKSDGSAKEILIFSQTPNLLAEERERRKIEAFKKIFYALEHRFEEEQSSKPL